MAKPIFIHLTDDFIERFWSHVEKRGPDECWPWTGMKAKAGYGRIKAGKASAFVASRVSLVIHLGRELGEGLMACHHCDNPPCVNPAHLYEGTPKQNAQDALKRGRFHRWRGGRRGESNTKAILTEDQVRQIRAIGRSRTQESMARQFGVNQVTISNIIINKTWIGIL